MFIRRRLMVLADELSKRGMKYNETVVNNFEALATPDGCVYFTATDDHLYFNLPYNEILTRRFAVSVEDAIQLIDCRISAVRTKIDKKVIDAFEQIERKRTERK